MELSMEVRWLFKGAIPAKVKTWFCTGFVPDQKAPLNEEERPDTYLRITGINDLGVKLRAGKKIEVKQRQGEGHLEEFPGGSKGLVEQWAKWSFALDGQATAPDISQPAGNWVTVKKWRLTRKFEVQTGDLVAAIDANVKKLPDEGCNMELARLTLTNGKVWWSLCFEAFSKSNTVEKNLDLVLKRAFADPAFPIMQMEDSYAYPTWLGMILSGK